MKADARFKSLLCFDAAYDWQFIICIVTSIKL